MHKNRYGGFVDLMNRIRHIGKSATALVAFAVTTLLGYLKKRLWLGVVCCDVMADWLEHEAVKSNDFSGVSSIPSWRVLVFGFWVFFVEGKSKKENAFFTRLSCTY